MTRILLDTDPSPRWVRATAGGVLVVDTRAAVLVTEPGKAVGFYAVPSADVRADLLDAVRSGRHVVVRDGDRALADDPSRVVQWRYPDPLPEVSTIAGHVAFFDTARRQQ